MENSSVSDYSLIDWGIEEVSKYVADDAVVDVEPRCEIVSGVGEGVYGYADLIAGEHIFDLKSGGIAPEPGYRAQLSGYALSHMEATFRDYVWCHELYIDAKYHRQYKVTLEEARETVDKILTAHLDPKSEPVACSFCKWCRHSLSCPALIEDIEDDEMKNFDLENPDQLSEALKVAKRLKVWCEAVEKAAKTHLHDGGELDGWRFQQRKGRESIDPREAHQALYSRMGSDKFMAACTVNLTKLRKIWDEHYNEDEFPIENLIVRSKDTFALVENKQTNV
tara:strand:+ start:1702 stop:2541 length:840 start_codon:yes stop_codon:yes gene_type:complete